MLTAVTASDVSVMLSDLVPNVCCYVALQVSGCCTETGRMSWQESAHLQPLQSPAAQHTPLSHQRVLSLWQWRPAVQSSTQTTCNTLMCAAQGGASISSCLMWLVRMLGWLVPIRTRHIPLRLYRAAMLCETRSAEQHTDHLQQSDVLSARRSLKLELSGVADKDSGAVVGGSGGSAHPAKVVQGSDAVRDPRC